MLWIPRPPAAILELIRDINRKLGITVVVITHQMSVVEEVCARGHSGRRRGRGTGLGGQDFCHPKTAAARRLVARRERSAEICFVPAG